MFVSENMAERQYQYASLLFVVCVFLCLIWYKKVLYIVDAMSTILLSEFNYKSGDKDIVKATGDPRYPYRIDNATAPSSLYEGNETTVVVSLDASMGYSGSVRFTFKGNKDFSYKETQYGIFYCYD